jgi:hypothetical protein
MKNIIEPIVSILPMDKLVNKRAPFGSVLRVDVDEYVVLFVVVQSIYLLRKLNTVYLDVKSGGIPAHIPI